MSKPHPPRAARAGRREQRKSETHRELVQAGRQLFSQEGIYSSRIEDIAHRAGIAKGTVYLYFRNKEALLGAVVQGAFEELQAHVRAHLEASAPATWPAELFRAHLTFYAANPDLMRILHQVRGLLKFSRARGANLRAGLRAHVEFLASCLARGPGADWSRARRRALALFLFASASGSASVMVAAFPEEARLERLAESWSAPVAEAARVFTEEAAPRRRRQPQRRG